VCSQPSKMQVATIATVARQARHIERRFTAYPPMSRRRSML
jgi:hypothetical protein